MKRILITAFSLTLLGVVACRDTTDTSTPASRLAITMASAFSAAPAGYGSLSSSYVGDEGMPFEPEFDAHGGGPGRGGPGFGLPGAGPGFGLGLMGGGLFGGFFGDGFGHDGFRPDTSCHYASGTGVTTCGPTTRDGLTVTKTIQFLNSAGQPQSAYDTATTNTVTSKATVSGTTTRHDNTTSTISSSSNQSVTGLASGSTKETVNSTSAGTENTTGTSNQGAFTAKRTAGDTVSAVVVPVPTSASPHPYPTAGTITRSMSATVTITGQAATTSTRREVITYDGSATAKVVITHDGVTQNCTLPLPHGHLTCS